MEKETLEGLVGKMKITDDKVDLFAYSLGLKEGAKWQEERMYSEGDIMNALHSVELKHNKDYSKIWNSIKEFLNNLKK